MTTLHRQPGSAGDFIASFVPEDVIAQTARGLAVEVGLQPVAPAVGAALRMLAGACAAKAVVEIGTGTGVSGLWLLRGMRADGVLTTIDRESEHQRMARRLFTEAGFSASRARVITGRALEVLPRLADGAYDLIFVDADPTEYAAFMDAAARLLRPGGVAVLHGVLTSGRDVFTVRELAYAVRDSDLWQPALLPLGEGLLAAVKA